MRGNWSYFLQCKKRNFLLRGGASAYKKAYNVACALFVKNLIQ